MNNIELQINNKKKGLLAWMPYRNEWEEYLKQFTENVRVADASHRNIYPKYNYEAWTDEERNLLENAVLSLGYGITQMVVNLENGYFVEKEVSKNKGFRIYFP